jgi:energy-coupling factor transporter transmembrane protein EcfT
VRKLLDVSVVRVALGICCLIMSATTLIGYVFNYQALLVPIDSLFSPPPTSTMAPTTAMAIALLSISTILDSLSRVDEASRVRMIDKKDQE